LSSWECRRRGRHEWWRRIRVGLAVGVPTAIVLARYVASQLHGMEARDPVIAGATIALLAVVSIAAGFIPALRASRIDPILALRAE
jgi:ABC-type antimicrobial peptide transport system permease subunit